MNHFQVSIVRSKNESRSQFNEVRIHIDGIDLIDMLNDFEKPLAKREGSSDIAGAYSGAKLSEDGAWY